MEINLNGLSVDCVVSTAAVVIVFVSQAFPYHTSLALTVRCTLIFRRVRQRSWDVYISNVSHIISDLQEFDSCCDGLRVLFHLETGYVVCCQNYLLVCDTFSGLRSLYFAPFFVLCVVRTDWIRLISDYSRLHSQYHFGQGVFRTEFEITHCPPSHVFVRFPISHPLD